MSDLADLPEPDRLTGAPHPRETARVIGQSEAEQTFLTAYTSGRLHHGWLLTGPRGTGKATLAWEIARFLLATPPDEGDGLFGAPPPPDTLHIDPEHPVARRMLALSEPGLFLLRRGGAGSTDTERDKALKEGRFSDVIRVDEIRKLNAFFGLSAADGGRRVVIVDSADEMTNQAANALLKMLEEPPARTTLLLLSHQPARLLPTIRSRCRTLRLAPLPPEDMAQALAQAGAEVAPNDVAPLTTLAEGSVGAAMRLLTLDGLALYREILKLLSGLPALDRAALLSLADSCAGKGKESRLDLVLTLADQLAARLARTGVTGHPPPEIMSGEGDMLTRLAPDPAAGRRWANVSQEAGDRARHARAVNIDPAALITDLFLHLQKAA
ncbi:DNA polymerase III subunit gamma/tau [Antarctobacter heliothermus]|uniref:DNA polymerase III subunit gamma/tau n=1 Tax=Antarctobacter heliothermus TaxID=74033 RepID=A0A222E9N4_9RHOB|nr:DNA polymerase III subunit delta' [Antarctobacter heliothermus]ASP22790.1 DNA polymerase III subunit gamma/tau [Antarctobacter heliothermus]